MGRIFLGIFGAVAAVLLGAQGASALSSHKSVFISGDNTFYVYVKAGEQISAQFTKVPYVEPLGFGVADIVVTVEGPGGAKQECTLASTIANGKGCTFAEQTASRTGIWKIDFKVPATMPLYKEVSPTVHWNQNMFSWRITVANAEGEQSGRIWSERYSIRQPNEAEHIANMSYHYMSEDGYLYRAKYTGYHGQLSMLAADAVGLRKNGTCTSAYRSIEVDDVQFSPSFGECGGNYKLFFEQPAGDLPATAERWDGETDWVRPSIARPIVEGLTFTPSDARDVQSGEISYVLKNFIGEYQVKIDVNNDGNFDASEDVKFTQRIEKLTSEPQKITFKGIDGDDQPVPREQKIGIKINIERLAEIHMVNADVEGRTGGLEIMRLSGDNAPRTNMCWNDTYLAPIDSVALRTDVVDGRACPESIDGAHGWAYGTGAWGDKRYIDDWAYAAARVDGTAEIVYPSDLEEQVQADRTTTMLGTIIAGLTGLIVVIGGVAFAVKARRGRQQRRAEQLLSPAQHPVVPPQSQATGVPNPYQQPPAGPPPPDNSSQYPR